MHSKTSSPPDSRYSLSEKTSETDDQRIKDVTPLPPPEHLIRFVPIAGTPVEKLIGRTRHAVRQIMQRKDDRLLVVMGPCSIHDPAAAIEYAKRLKVERDKALCDIIVPLDSQGKGGVGSTDVGDVSWAVPTVQARGATYAIGTPGHSWQLTAQGKSGIAHKGLVHVAKIMAGTAVDAISNPEILAAAKADHKARTDAHPYVCPLPADVKPPIGMSGD